MHVAHVPTTRIRPSVAASPAWVQKLLEDNPYHDEKGQFTFAQGSAAHGVIADAVKSGTGPAKIAKTLKLKNGANLHAVYFDPGLDEPGKPTYNKYYLVHHDPLTGAVSVEKKGYYAAIIGTKAGEKFQGHAEKFGGAADVEAVPGLAPGVEDKIKADMAKTFGVQPPANISDKELNAYVDAHPAPDMGDEMTPEQEKEAAKNMGLDDALKGDEAGVKGALAGQEIVHFNDKDFKKLSGAKGSNEGGVYESKITGKKYYIKKMDEAHAANEVLANRLYKLAGVPVPNVYRLAAADGQHGIASEIVEGSSIPAGSQDYEAARSNFAADAWLANWDTVGAAHDNMILGKDSMLYRIDMGGALEFRAKGKPKGEKFGTEPTELNDLRNKNMNPNAAGVFGSMSVHDIGKSINKVAALPDGQIEDTVMKYGSGSASAKKALADKLIARKNNLSGVPLSEPTKTVATKQVAQPKGTEETFSIPLSNSNPDKGHAPNAAVAMQYMKAAGMTEAEANAAIGAVQHYTGSGYAELNRRLVMHLATDQDVAYLKKINKFLKAHKTFDPNVVLHRGTYFEKQQIEAMQKHVGKIIYNQPHVGSYSSERPAWIGSPYNDQYERVALHVDTGHKSFVGIRHISHHFNENEVLAPPGTQLRVVGYKKIKGTHHFHLREIEQTDEHVLAHKALEESIVLGVMTEEAQPKHSKHFLMRQNSMCGHTLILNGKILHKSKGDEDERILKPMADKYEAD